MGLHLCTALTSVSQLLSGWGTLCRPLRPPESGQEWDGSSLKPSCWDCPGDPLRISASSIGPSLVRELRSHKPGNTAKRKNTAFLILTQLARIPFGGQLGVPLTGILALRPGPHLPLLCSIQRRMASSPLLSPQVCSAGDIGRRLTWASRLDSHPGLLSQLSSCWNHGQYLPRRAQFSSVMQSCPTLCNPINRSMPGLPVHYQLPDLAQIHVQWVSDAIQPSFYTLLPAQFWSNHPFQT